MNCVQPGLIDTAQIRRLYPGDERRTFAEREIVLRDFGEPQDVANMVSFLASPRTHYITGAVIPAFMFDEYAMFADQAIAPARAVVKLPDGVR
ncbi:hypothetical protein GWA01_08280 [Gluconobacter wancherniae NBRC 103581]|uniref:Uncharacterized protein n=1 Tax=Gluconobacter wancherniae NBRC 103581 TaxID=656744 RepID=A0A511AXX1_9PROT|nr:hypothetical protein AA103581_0629 [Gluconobacter wancherniae NBRC 103581]GEK93058.1 hypothetical protein GWA01_08280 [Gluconobacter wancherniae NBRC 103581]